jgi:Protein of unknown function (DUF1631)
MTKEPINQLLSQSIASNIIGAEDNRHVDLLALSNHFASALLDALPPAFDRMDDALFDLANNARNNNEQNRYFEAMRELRLKRRGIEQKFSDELTARFNPKHVERKDEKKELDSATLALVNDARLEEDLAISTMANKARANMESVLLPLNRRVSVIYGVNEDKLNSPLSPTAISESFANASSQLDIELSERLLLLKQFDKLVMPKIQAILADINESLANSGILRELSDSEVRRSAKKTFNPSAVRSPQTPHSAQTSNSLIHTQEEVLSSLTKLIAANRDLQQPIAQKAKLSSKPQRVAQNKDNAPADINDLLEALNAVQNEQLDLLDNRVDRKTKALNIEAALRYELLALGSRGQKQPVQKQLKQSDVDLISLVSMLFEFILGDQNLAPSMQVLISRLQIPILKVVIQDPSFFNSKKHPARRLLDSLAHTGIGWVETPELEKDSLYCKIKYIVNRVVDDFDGDIALFEKLYAEFVSFWASEQKRQRILEERTKKSEEGRIKSRKAQQVVDDTIQTLLSEYDSPLPEIFKEVLTKAWSRVMFLAYLRDEDEHNWESTRRVAEDLIWCVYHCTHPEDRQRWVAVVPRLLKELEAGLSVTSFNSLTLEETMTAIKNQLTENFREHAVLRDSANGALRGNVKRKPKLESGAISDQKVKTSEDYKVFSAQVSALSKGQWVEFTLLNGKTYRCKLASHIADADSFIFVDRMGLKPIEKSKDDLIQDLAKKNLRLLDRGALIDRALDHMMSNLKQNNS